MLPAASSAAGALLAVNDYYHVTHFARSVVDAVDDLAADDNTAADARAESDGNKVAHALADARNCLAESGAVSVIVDINGLMDPRFEHFLCGDLVEVKIVGKFNIACCLIDRAWSTDAH